MHFILELYGKICYLIGTNTHNSRSITRRISRKIVKENFVIKAIYLGGGQFFIKNFNISNKPRLYRRINNAQLFFTSICAFLHIL